jgi:hypothetical protein
VGHEEGGLAQVEVLGDGLHELGISRARVVLGNNDDGGLVARAGRGRESVDELERKGLLVAGHGCCFS